MKRITARDAGLMSGRMPIMNQIGDERARAKEPPEALMQEKPTSLNLCAMPNITGHLTNVVQKD